MIENALICSLFIMILYYAIIYKKGIKNKKDNINKKFLTNVGNFSLIFFLLIFSISLILKFIVPAAILYLFVFSMGIYYLGYTLIVFKKLEKPKILRITLMVSSLIIIFGGVFLIIGNNM